MLVIMRQHDERIVIGDGDFALVPLSRRELDTLRTYARNTPSDTLAKLGLSSLGQKLDEAEFRPIEICQIETRGDKSRIGVEAPKYLPVHRKEVYDAIQRERRAAQQVKPEDVAALATQTPDPAERRAGAL